MKIREKIFLGVGTYIFLAALIGFYAFYDLYTITSKLPILDRLDQVTSTILELRRHEKNYLLYHEDGELQEVNQRIALLKTETAKLHASVPDDLPSHEQVQRLIDGITRYTTAFSAVAAGREAERAASGALAVAGDRFETVVPLSAALHDVRLKEKEFLLRRDRTSFTAFDQAAASLGRATEGLKHYQAKAASLRALIEGGQHDEEHLRVVARELQEIPESLYRTEREEVPATMRRTMKLLLIAMLTIIILGAYVNTKLALGIATPLRRLEEKTKKIAMGDFTEEIEVKGDDELASLARSFANMEERQKLALSSLEHTIERLQEQQEKLIEAEKMASVGILTAGIAHEINNPLTSVLSFSKLMLEQTPETDPNHNRLRIMLRDAQRARMIVRDLLSFAKETPIRTMKIGIYQPVVEIIESLIAQDAFKGIELILDFAEDLPDIEADPVRIGQVVLNLVLNAIHSIEPPGRIEVMTRRADGMIEIVVNDTGHGIPEKDRNRIFDPFFTTKGPRKGTGLGLAISYGIIKAHGGDIVVQSALGKGSTFIVRLPIHG